MRFYVGVGFLDPLESFETACLIERIGFDGYTLGDHLALAEKPARPYPSPDGRPSFPIDAPWPDPWVLGGALAAATSRLHLLTTVYLLALRHPMQAAKSIATAQLLGGGRVEVGVGVGWQSDEFEASGVDFTTRGARTDEMIDVLRKLWAPGPTSHDGRFFEFPTLFTEPTLHDPPPILIGGSSPAAFRRAAERGDGFITMPTPTADLPALITMLRRAVETAGRDPATFAIYANSSDATTRDDYARLAEMGVDVALVRPANMSPTDGTADRLERFADDVLANMPIADDPLTSTD